MNMRASGGTGHGAAKSDKWNPGLPQVVEHGLAFGALWVERDIDSVAMIESHAVMGWGLTERADR